MSGSARRDATFTLLDGVALVVAAAVASVHMKSPVESASGTGWVLVWLALAGVGLTAAGPIIYLARRFGRNLSGYPGLGDRLWGLLGAPWVVTAPLRASRAADLPRAFRTYGITLTATVITACLIVLAVLWRKYVLTPPAIPSKNKGPASWTTRVGMIVSVTWPLQLGYLLLVLGSEFERFMDRN